MEMNEFRLDCLCDALDNLKLPIPEELYNYVGYGLVQKFFCKDADISCGSAIDMNDKYEVEFGAKEILRQWLDSNVITTAACEMLMQNVEANYSCGRSLIKPQQVLVPYIFSLSSIPDSAYMWKSYISDPNGGYRIGFNSYLLQAAIKDRNKTWGSALSLIPVFYGETNRKEISILCAALASDVCDEIKLFNRSPLHAAEAAKRIMGSVFSFAPHIKDKQWAKEQEWRLKLPNENCDAVRNDGKIERLNTHLLDAGFPPAYFMTSIMISPQGNEQLLRENIARFLAPNEEDGLPRSKLSQSVVKNYIELSKTEECNSAAEFLEYQDYVLDETAKSDGVEVMSFTDFKEKMLGHNKEEASHV